MSKNKRKHTSKGKRRAIARKTGISRQQFVSHYYHKKKAQTTENLKKKINTMRFIYGKEKVDTALEEIKK